MSKYASNQNLVKATKVLEDADIELRAILSAIEALQPDEPFGECRLSLRIVPEKGIQKNIDISEHSLEAREILLAVRDDHQIQVTAARVKLARAALKPIAGGDHC